MLAEFDAKVAMELDAMWCGNMTHDFQK